MKRQSQMEVYISDEEGDMYWIDWFLQCKGNEYLCEIDEDFILDRFNLTSLSSQFNNFNQSLEIITDRYDAIPEHHREMANQQAAKLYGLIHARYIITARGLLKMAEKYRNVDFGRCPRLHCKGQPVLPIGQSDNYGEGKTRLYCPKCEDVYIPKSTKHSMMDGSYFGTTFAPFFFLSYPSFIPRKSPIEQYEPKIFGFKVHANATVRRLQYRIMDEDFQKKAASRYVNAKAMFDALEEREENEQEMELNEDKN